MKKVVIAFSALALFVSCVKKSSDAPTEPPPEVVIVPPPPEPPPTTVDVDLDVTAVRTDEVSGRVCLHLEMVYGRLKSFPAEARVWQGTIPVKPPESKLSAHYWSYVANSIFEAREASAPDFGAHLAAARQTGCDEITFDSGLAGKATFKVTSYEADTPNLVVIDGSRTTIYTLTGPREMEIRRQGERQDLCPNEPREKVGTITKVRWGTAADLAEVAFALDGADLKEIVATRPSLSESARARVEWETQFPLTYLSEIAVSPVATEFLNCEKPVPSPTPTPAPVLP